MTSLPARILGLRDRGQIRDGFAADVAGFDPATVEETNSFEKPKSSATGVRYTIVNGGDRDRRQPHPARGLGGR
jgi:N-acyl-D-amino-acid deacylase